MLPVTSGSTGAMFSLVSPWVKPGGGTEIVRIAFFEHFKDFAT